MNRRAGLVAGGVLCALTFLTYAPAMRAGFVWNDDDLTNNIVFEDDGLYRVWFTAESVNYWPMVWTSYWVEHALWGFSPAGYHVVNVLIHIACALLIWRILLQLKIPGAYVVALIFAVHPVNVESVAWITQRKNTLSLFFFLLSLSLYLRFDDGGRRKWYWFAAAAFLLAMLSKGMAATLPVVILLALWWRNGRIGGKDLLRTIPFFGIALLMSAAEIWFQEVRAIADHAVRDDGFLSRLAGAGWVVWFYIYKALLPIRLAFVYPRWEIDPASWLSFVPDLALMAIGAICWRRRKSWGRPCLFALGFYVVTLAPVLGFVNIYFMRYSFVADHYQYLSIVGMIALAVAGARVLLLRQERRLGRIGPAVAAPIVLLLCALSWRQARIYHDSETLWNDAIRKNPRAWIGHQILGIHMRRQGRLDEAAQHYHRALVAQPDDAETLNNLGMVLGLQGRLDEAIDRFEAALRSDPRHANAHYNLGKALGSIGEIDLAVDHFRRAIRLVPEDAKAHYNLGVALAAQGAIEESAEHYGRAVELQPDYAMAHHNLGILLQQGGDNHRALKHFLRAVAISPDRPDWRYNVGAALLAAGRSGAAYEHFQEAARLKPDWAPPLRAIAWILATDADSDGRARTRAVLFARRAAELTGYRDAAVVDTLAVALASEGNFEQAVPMALRALDLSSGEDSSEFAKAVSSRLVLYRQSMPYRPANRNRRLIQPVPP